MTRIVFLGTPSAAVPTLLSLVDEYEVARVITQPDRPRGRSQRLMPSPVKEAALRAGLPVAQPENRDSLLSSLGDEPRFDLGVVVAYGRLLTPAMLRAPRAGLLNVHFSLLPRWRGAAPVRRAILAGDNMTGVSIIRLDEGLDTGPILTAQAIDIDADENAGDLTERLASIGARLLMKVLPSYLNGDIEPATQTDDGATYAAKLSAGDRPLDLNLKRIEIINRVRGLAPSPAATLELDGELHKILAASTHPDTPRPGTWESVDGSPVVGAADGGVELQLLQRPGRIPQRGPDWVRGRHKANGVVGQSGE